MTDARHRSDDQQWREAERAAWVDLAAVALAPLGPVTTQPTGRVSVGHDGDRVEVRLEVGLRYGFDEQNPRTTVTVDVDRALTEALGRALASLADLTTAAADQAPFTGVGRAPLRQRHRAMHGLHRRGPRERARGLVPDGGGVRLPAPVRPRHRRAVRRTGARAARGLTRPHPIAGGQQTVSRPQAWQGRSSRVLRHPPRLLSGLDVSGRNHRSARVDAGWASALWRGLRAAPAMNPADPHG